MDYYLGVDVGATHLRAAVATGELDVVGRVIEPAPRDSGGASVSERVIQVVTEACGTAGIDPDDIATAGIGSTGPIDRDAGALVEPANLPGERGRVQLVQPLSDVLRTDRIILQNDATCGVIGERYFVDPGAENMVYLTFSTGIGAGVVVDGDVVSGHDGNAGEVGHMTVDPTGAMTCQCGGAGHWEAYCGGANIPRYATHVHREEGVETALPVGTEGFTTEDVFALVGEDELADLVVERLGRWNAIGVANVVQAFAPASVAIGGAVALNNPDAILGPIRRQVHERVLLEAPDIGPTDLGEDVVLMGALVLARRHSSGRKRSE